MGLGLGSVGWGCGAAGVEDGAPAGEGGGLLRGFGGEALVGGVEGGLFAQLAFEAAHLVFVVGESDGWDGIRGIRLAGRERSRSVLGWNSPASTSFSLNACTSCCRSLESTLWPESCGACCWCWPLDSIKRTYLGTYSESGRRRGVSSVVSDGHEFVWRI